MSDDPDNLIQRILRRIGGQNDRIKARLGEIASGIGLLERHALLSLWLDRMDERVVRIGRRFDPVEA